MAKWNGENINGNIFGEINGEKWNAMKIISMKWLMRRNNG
jgi:hypothetical protein